MAGTNVRMRAESPVPRPVVSTLKIEVGGANARSTYLSPLRYSGPMFGLSGEWQKAFQKNPDHVVMSFAGAINFKNMLNPPVTARMLGIDARFNWGMAYRHRFPHNLQLTAGGLLDISGGVLYLTRNGNNPVTVPAYAGVDLDLGGSWKFTLGRLPMLLSERLSIPTLGAFFNPAYGETFYEIYIGNRKGLAHCGWWGNAFGAANLISLKIDFGRTAMEIGYRYDFRSFYSGNLVTRIASNSFVIGVIPGGIGLKNKRNINSPLY